MKKYLSLGWGVPLGPGIVDWIAKRHGVTANYLLPSPYGLLFGTYEVEGEEKAIASFMAEMGAEDAAA